MDGRVLLNNLLERCSDNTDGLDFSSSVYNKEEKERAFSPPPPHRPLALTT
jgi:hypothetical protein